MTPAGAGPGHLLPPGAQSESEDCGSESDSRRRRAAGESESLAGRPGARRSDSESVPAAAQWPGLNLKFSGGLPSRSPACRRLLKTGRSSHGLTAARPAAGPPGAEQDSVTVTLTVTAVTRQPGG